MKRLRLFIASVAVLLAGCSAMPALSYAATTPTQTACQAVSGNAKCTDNSGGPTLNKIVSTIINILSLLIGVIAVIMIIVGGLRYVTSAGDANAISGAKNTIIYAVVGLVVVALAQALVQFVLGRVT